MVAGCPVQVPAGRITGIGVLGVVHAEAADPTAGWGLAGPYRDRVNEIGDRGDARIAEIDRGQGLRGGEGVIVRIMNPETTTRPPRSTTSVPGPRGTPMSCSNPTARIHCLRTEMQSPQGDAWSPVNTRAPIYGASLIQVRPSLT